MHIVKVISTPLTCSFSPKGGSGSAGLGRDEDIVRTEPEGSVG